MAQRMLRSGYGDGSALLGARPRATGHDLSPPVGLQPLELAPRRDGLLYIPPGYQSERAVEFDGGHTVPLEIAREAEKWLRRSS